MLPNAHSARLRIFSNQQPCTYATVISIHIWIACQLFNEGQAGMSQSKLFAWGSTTPLEGRLVHLDVLSPDDYIELARTCLDPEIWRSTIAKIGSATDLKQYLERGLAQRAADQAMPFVIRLRADGRAIGSTRLAITSENDTLEIGWTFIATPWHRSGVNADAKLILLSHAFEVLGCRRVVFKASVNNERSKAAIASLGAVGCPAVKKDPADAEDKTIQWFELPANRWPETRVRLETKVARASAAVRDA
ncbi:GNAT family N-acetyltransferase [Pinirhizobacter soli]|uniref:GNAT family N-acetyltransferase n=1 Tax=Pinirhizobacter soli TaxID=2786953 RepID=UPI002029C90C|nr:GNAT family N-acetyltransferase [Pinirhizobacter soli]